MDRARRRFLVASTILAIPVALMMASLSSGTAPAETAGEITHAVGDASQRQGDVQQVVGKQLEARNTRPGLLQVLSGSESRGSRNHRHKNMAKSQPKGLLDGWFDGGSKSKKSAKSSHKRSTHNHASNGNSQNQLRANQASRENWDGVPYHQVSKTGRKKGSTPIRDLNARGSSAHGSSAHVARSTPKPAGRSGTSQTRIIRGGATRKIEAKTVSTRRPSSQPNPARRPANPDSEPRLASVPTENVSETRSGGFSSDESSRRSDRRIVGALDASEIAAASRRPVAAKVVAKPDPDLVPRIVRKDVQKKKELQPSPAPTAAEKPAAVVAAKQATPTPPLAAAPAQISPAAPATATPTPGTALAAIGTPTAAFAPTEPESAAKATPAQSTPAAAKNYTLPVDPQTTPVPIAGVPSHPYAASIPASGTPAISASHRVGPPSAAFVTSPQNTTSLPLSPLQFKATSAPVGSGVATHSNTGSQQRPYRSSTPQVSIPAHQIAQQPQTHDPYASNRNQAIYRQQSNVPAGLGDNFAPTIQGSRNQMRDALGSLSPLGQLPKGSAASELPGIRVVTVGPDSIMIRQTSQYEIRVENRGSIDAKGVMIRALVPDWADLRSQSASRGSIDTVKQGSTERLVWTIDHLPAGSTERMFVRVTAARSGTYDIDVDWTLAPQKSVAKIQVREPRLDLTIEGPDEVIFGQSQTYKVRVLNPGDGTAPNVVFTLSPDSTPQTQRIGDIPPGKEAQFDVELTAQNLGDLKIHGLANGDYELRAESTKTIRVAAARLVAELTGPELKYQNTEAMYSLQLQNTGQATCERIVATLQLPAGVEYLGGIDGASMQGNVLRWEINALAPSSTRDYRFRCNMGSTGDHLFSFDCKGSAAGNADVALATRVESISDLVLTISDPAAPAPIGSDVIYEIVIRNRGSKEARDVRAIAQFGHGIEPLRIEGQSGEIVTGQVLFDAIPRIGAGQEVRLRVIAEAERAGHHRFRTEVRSGDTVLVAEEATHYMSPTSDRVSRRSTDSATVR